MSGSLLAHSSHEADTTKTSRLFWVLLWIFLGLWLLNAGVFYALYHHHHPAMGPRAFMAEALYRSLQLFHLHDTHWAEVESAHERLALFIARFSAAIFGLGLPPLVLGWFCRGGVRRWWHRRWWHHGFIVVVGQSADAAHLVENLVARRRRVVRVRAPEAHSAASHHGPAVPTFVDDLHDLRFWREEVRLARAGAVVLLLGADAENIRLSLTLEEAVRGARRQGPPLRCYVHLADLHLRKHLVSLLPPQGELGAMALHYFNRYEIIARLLARRHPLPVGLADAASPGEHYVIVGFGQFGQNVALKLVKMGQQVLRPSPSSPGGFQVRKPRLTIVDRQGTRAAENFLRSYPGFRETCEWNVIETDCRATPFLELGFLRPGDAAGHCSLIFCLEDEALVVTTILMMLDICQRPEKDIDGIYLRSPESRGLGRLLQEQQPAFARQIPIVSFAPDREVFTEDVVMNLSLDLMAQTIHEAWLPVAARCVDPHNLAPAANKNWRQLSEDERDGNREPADHMWAKVRTLGLRLEERPLTGGPVATPTAEDAALARQIEENMELLASAEHYRWMAWRLINGWTHGAEREEARKLHPDIKAYEDLPEAVKDKDRVIVRAIPELLRLGGLRAAK